MQEGGTFTPTSTGLLLCHEPARKQRVGLVMHDYFLCTQTQLYTHLIISNRVLYESHAIMRENVHYAQFMFCISELERENSKEARKWRRWWKVQSVALTIVTYNLSRNIFGLTIWKVMQEMGLALRVLLVTLFLHESGSLKLTFKHQTWN